MERAVNEAPPVTPMALVLFVAALVLVPAYAAGAVIYDMSGESPTRGIVGSAAIGVVIGAAAVAARSLRKREIGSGSRGEAIASALIITAAVAAPLTDALPSRLGAFLHGLVFGFFVAFDILLVRRWQKDPEFRTRVRSLGSRAG